MKKAIYLVMALLGGLIMVSSAYIGSPFTSFVGAAHLAFAVWKLTERNKP